MERTEIVISFNKSTLTRRTISEEDVDVSEEMVRELGDQMTRSSKSVLTLDPKRFPQFGPASVCLSNEGSYWTVPILQLPLKTNYRIENGELYPDFSAKDEPVMPMIWTPPSDMRLVLVVIIKNYDGIRKAENQWLFGLDTEKRSWRLPLGNSFEDGHLCSGDFERTRKTDMECLEAEAQQMIDGQWQGDLNLKPAETKQMFRFKPKNDGFEQLPPQQHWQKLCMKIAPAVLKFVI